MPRNELVAGRADRVVTLTLPADQRNAIFAEVRTHLLSVDDLRLAIEAEEHEAAERLARRFVGELLLIQNGLGWDMDVREPVHLSLPADELRLILEQLRDTAIDLYEAQRSEQEAFRAPWERATLVRDACNDALARLAEK